MPFEDKIFDVVWSTEVIEHLYHVQRYLHEINRVLKPNGLFILTAPYHGIIKICLLCYLVLINIFAILKVDILGSLQIEV
jgi:ubiquinone/menaquinone biosynthesis C-methylase UbiE